MLFNKSPFVYVYWPSAEDPQQTFKFERPSAREQQAWESRLVAFKAAGEDEEKMLELADAELDLMIADLSMYLRVIDGEVGPYTKDQLHAGMSPRAVGKLWGEFVGACTANEAERGKSEPQLNARSTQGVATTADDAQTPKSTGEDVLTH